MRISSKREYCLLAGLSVFTLVIVLFSDFFRIIVGFPYVFLVPGYLLTTVLFPKADDIEDLVRISLSVGLSIIIVPLIGLLQNYLPWGITLLSMVLSITALNSALMALGWIRRNKLPEEQRFTFTVPVDRERIKEKFKKNKSIYLALLGIGLVLFTALIYIVFSPKTGDSFTEFYITGQNYTKTTGYPKLLKVGEDGKVQAVIVNDENKKTVYRIEIRVDDELIQSIKDISLDPDENWENTVSFKAVKPNTAAKVEFLLFRENRDTTPYRQLHLWVTVYS